jgi:hypothetical protein
MKLGRAVSACGKLSTLSCNRKVITFPAASVLSKERNERPPRGQRHAGSCCGGGCRSACPSARAGGCRRATTGLRAGGCWSDYTYDLGDCWEHRLSVTDVRTSRPNFFSGQSRCTASYISGSSTDSTQPIASSGRWTMLSSVFPLDRAAHRRNLVLRSAPGLLRFKWPARTRRLCRFWRDFGAAAAQRAGWWRLQRPRLDCCGPIRCRSRPFAASATAETNMSVSSTSTSMTAGRR